MPLPFVFGILSAAASAGAAVGAAAAAGAVGSAAVGAVGVVGSKALVAGTAAYGAVGEVAAYAGGKAGAAAMSAVKTAGGSAALQKAAAKKAKALAIDAVWGAAADGALHVTNSALGTNISKSQAQDWYQEANEYYYGWNGRHVNHSEAQRLYKLAANSGHQGALNQLRKLF